MKRRVQAAGAPAAPWRAALRDAQDDLVFSLRGLPQEVQASAGAGRAGREAGVAVRACVRVWLGEAEDSCGGGAGRLSGRWQLAPYAVCQSGAASEKTLAASAIAGWAPVLPIPRNTSSCSAACPDPMHSAATDQPTLLPNLSLVQVDEEARMAVWGPQVAVAFPSAGAQPPRPGPAALPHRPGFVCLPAV